MSDVMTVDVPPPTLHQRRKAAKAEDWDEICHLMDEGVIRREGMSPQHELEDYWRPLYRRWCEDES